MGDGRKLNIKNKKSKSKIPRKDGAFLIFYF